MRILMLLLLAMLPLVLGAPPSGPALPLADQKAPTKFRWDLYEPEEPDIAGFRMRFGTSSGVYTLVIDAGMPSVGPDKTGELSYISDPVDLEPGKKYFSVLTAYNTYGLESGYSDEITFTAKTAPAAPINYR